MGPPAKADPISLAPRRLYLQNLLTTRVRCLVDLHLILSCEIKLRSEHDDTTIPRTNHIRLYGSLSRTRFQIRRCAIRKGMFLWRILRSLRTGTRYRLQQTMYGDESLTCGGTWAQNIYDVLYIGCYIDKTSRDLEGGMTVTNTNTPTSCIKLCAENGYPFAGVQYAKECFCGTSYSAHGKAPESDCNKPCTGDASLTCGGTWRQNIYLVPGRRS
ncbi:hypothetical protein ScPMuIL_007490 [Solemya velum]